MKLLEEYGKHPITLQVTKAYSPASIGKAYLKDMGITPVLERQSDFPKEYLGYAQSAFFGGRTSAHIRKIPVPVVYCDFLSMYPTVNSLMDLWRFVTAQKIDVIEHCEAEIRAFLSKLTADDLFDPDTWKHLPAFVKLIPDGDILPCRSKFSHASNDWQVSVNHLYAEPEGPNRELWFSLPDVVASVLLTGRIPKIVDAFRLEPRGELPALKPTKLRGKIEVDPKTQDFFRIVIEERKQMNSRSDLSKTDKERLDKALKVLANATSYGIYAEMNREESDKQVEVICHGIDAKPFKCRVENPESPGECCFPPFASLITGAARLMLALLETCITEMGGTYAMEDTDSMAIVASEHGGLIPCPGGPLQTDNGEPAVKALSWEQAREIVERFERLNPYNREAIPGSILKIEDVNFDPETKQQRQLYCFAISAKRYALFAQDKEFTLVKYSEHGLGHLLNPCDPESNDRDWIAQVWRNILAGALGHAKENVEFEDLPAVGRVTVSSPSVMKPLMALNKGKSYGDQIKPFNFLLSCHIKPLGSPFDTDPEQFHLIAPYESNPNKWLKLKWIDQYSGKTYPITTRHDSCSRQLACVKTYGEILREYEFHAESKCADSSGKRSDKRTIGLLQRRHIRIERIRYIGKESNKLEEAEAGLLHSAKDAYTEYPDPKRDDWELNIRPALRQMSLPELQKKTGLSRRMLLNARIGLTRPHKTNQQRLAELVINRLDAV